MANPTYQSGFYAPGRGTALHPELWGGCVGAWNPGLGNTGLSLRDWSGNGNHGVLTNMDAATDWPVDTGAGGVRALDFDNINDTVACAHVAELLDTDSAVSLWYKPVTIAGLNGIWDQWTGAQNGLICFRSGTAVAWQIGSPRLTAGTLVANVWNHIVCQKLAGNSSLTVNGVTSTIAAPGDNSLTTPLTIGTPNTGGVGFVNARIDDFRIYSRGLTTGEITHLGTSRGIAYERAPRKFYSLPAAASSRQYRLFRPAILRGA